MRVGFLEKRLKVLFLLAVVLLSTVLLSFVFDFLVFTGTSPKSGGARPSDTTLALNSTSNASYSKRIGVDSCLSADNSSLSILFFVRGVTNTSYLRNIVGETYQDGNWLPEGSASFTQYTGGQIAHSVANYSSAYDVSFEIQPSTAFGGFIPSTKDTNRISLNSSLQYYADQQIFFSEYTFTSSYNLSCTSYGFDEKTLREAETVPDDRYLQVSSDLLQKLKPLALNITQSLTSPFDRAVAIEDFLRQNYSYDLNYTRAPANIDPVEWFLFNSKSGVCTHFNSAFVLLARSIGIPARLCAGFLMDASSNYQAVKANQRHAYAEVLFKDLGWITFDATGFGNGLKPEAKPFVKILHPTQGMYVSGQRISISGQASGFNKDAELSINNTGFNLTYWKDDFVYDNDSFIADGTYSVMVSAADSSGNNASDVVTFTVDNTPPKVKIEYPANGTSLAGSSIYINGSVLELNKDDLTPFIDDPRFRLVSWDNSSGAFSFANITEVTGDVSTRVSFVDQAGNVGSDCVTFKVEPESSTRIPTRTNITYCSTIGIKGSTFTAEGQVLDLGGSGVSNLNVLVYLSKSKNENGTLCGQGKTADGYFNITCYVAKGVGVGNYQVVAYTVGDGQYEDSWSDPPIRIMAETNLSIAFPSKVIMGRTFTVNGTLREKLTNQPIPNQTLFLSIGIQNYSLVTDAQGFFISNYTLESPGDYTILANFNGSETYLNSTMSGTMRIVGITILPTTNTTLIRSENASLTGRVFAEDVPLGNERLDLVVGWLISTFSGPVDDQGHFNATGTVSSAYLLSGWDLVWFTGVPTDGQGYFNVTFPISENQTLGPTVVTYMLQRYPVSAMQNVTIVARTSLTCVASQTLNLGDTINITATLQDDNHQPVANASVQLNCLFYNEPSGSFGIEPSFADSTGITDINGTVKFTGIPLPADIGKNFTYEAFFSGNTLYLPSLFQGGINTSFGTHLDLTLLTIAAVLPTSVTAVGVFLWKRKRNKSPSEQMPEEITAETSLPTTVPAKTLNLSIKFPEISPKFPLVWGVNEPLTIELQPGTIDKPLSSADFSLKADDATDISLNASGSTVQASHVFNIKGSHKLKAKSLGREKWGDASAEVEIRVVDYREEIVDLFNLFFKSAKTKFQSVHDEMTPRELQAAVVSQIQGPKHESLETAVSIFEVADYSLHEVTRNDYEQIYLAMKDLEG